MSKIKVNSIEAATGSTITIPSGQTLDISSTTLTLPSTVVTTTGTQTLTNKTIGVSQLSGTLPVANGGTGLTTLGTAAQVLRVNSGATALEFGTVSGGVLKVTSFTNSTRTSLSANSTNNYELWSGTVNRTSATSNMVMMAGLPMATNTNHPNIGNFCKLNTSRKRAGNYHNNTTSCQSMEVLTYFSSADLGSTTGNIDWAIGWNFEKSISSDGSTVKPAEIWNYNGSDDGRATQSVSQLIIWELGV